MQRSLIETLMGAVVLAVAALFLVFAYSSADIGRGGGYELYAEFSTVGGLRVGNDVRMSGIKIGSVVRQDLNPETFLARVTLNIDDTITLPADTSASIASESLLGGNYLDLAPGGEDKALKPGDRIQYTQDAVDLIQLLGKFMFSPGTQGTGGAVSQ